MPRDPFAELIERIAELERRLANILRPARVTKTEDGLLTVTDDAGFDPQPMQQMSISSGGWKIDAPANVGAQGWVFSPEGDISQGKFLPTIPSGENPSASTDTGTLRLKGPAGEIVEISGGVVNFKNVSMNLGGMGGKGVARLGDEVTCPAGKGTITSSSNSINAVD